MRVYVVWHTFHEKVLAVYSTEAQAQALCQKAGEGAEALGYSYPYMTAEYDAFDLDAEPAEVEA